MNLANLFEKLSIAIYVSGKDFEYENEKAREIRLKENVDRDSIFIKNKIYKIHREKNFRF